MECPFFIGQKVVCIDDVFRDPDWKQFTVPIKNQIYTIRDIYIGYFKDETTVAIHLQEIINPFVPSYAVWGCPNGEVGFYWKRFRPLRETNIKVFKEILAKCSKELETI